VAERPNIDAIPIPSVSGYRRLLTDHVGRAISGMSATASLEPRISSSRFRNENPRGMLTSLAGMNTFLVESVPAAAASVPGTFSPAIRAYEVAMS
jgi:hypothetical protein